MTTDAGRRSPHQGRGTTATAADDDRNNGPDKPKGFLATLERVGNALPNPFWLFVILAGVVIVSSWLGAMAGMSAEDPGTGEVIEVENLMTAEYLQKMVTDAVDNFVTFAPVGLILVCMLGVAVAEYSGFIGAAIRSAVARVRSPMWLTFVVALAGVTGSVASDAVYVILIPLGAATFRAVGRNPIVGAMVAFAASSAGFNSSLVLNITDVLLAGISTTAAQFVDPEYVVSPLANYFFSMASAVVLAIIITAVTELFIVKHTKKTIDESQINYEAAAFTKPDDADGTDDSTGFGSAGTSSESNGENLGETRSKAELRDELELDAREIGALRIAGFAALATFTAWSALLFIPGSPLRGEGDGILNSPLLTDIVVPIALLFAITGIAYGIAFGSIRDSSDIPGFMEKGLSTLTAMMVLFFAVAQFTSYFSWSNLGQWTAIKGAELLTRADLPPLVLFAALVLMVAALNLFITSGSAQWALMAPVVVPMLMYVDIAPEVSQMLFRIGDSPSNIITPMSPYFALALTFLQKYYKPAGVGTLMSLAIPYFIAMLVGWFAFFAIWYLLGIPLGPGVPVR
ncbi:AbgT family transporter [Corynebacterium freneyi]|uniref:AbgT family transporter n=1 Tax=Corynebacterium freneyi TaxID=134034 RepID=UPI002549F218|nr:AbgT family transporter [Corynebacterium freneyi]MDK8768579.1 AbgT family transporter [Corynebacterium freneyi]